MQVTGSSQEGFEQALQDAIQQAPPQGDVPRRYEVVRSWVDSGGIAGFWYRSDVLVSGPDVPGDDLG